MVMDNRTLIEIDAKDLATPKIDKFQGKIKDTAKSTGLLSTAFGDLTSKAEDAGIPIQGIQKYIGALGAGGLAAGAVVGIGAVAVGMGVLSFNTIQSTADLKDFADQTGLSVEQLTSMDLALKTSNVSTQQYSDAMTKFTINMGKYAKEFKQIGITAKDQQQAFEQFRKKISETTDPIERARLGNMAFGKSFKDLMPLLRMTEQEFQNLKASSNVISTDQAEKAAELADKFDIMKAKIGGTATNIGLSMMPAMESLFNLFEKMLPVITGTLSVFGKIADVIIKVSVSIASAITTAFDPLVKALDAIWKKAKDVLGISDEVKEKESYRSQQFVESRSKMQSQLTPEQQRLMGFGASTNEEILSGWKPKEETQTPSTPTHTDTKQKLVGSAKERYEESLGLNPYGMGNLMQSKIGSNRPDEDQQKIIDEQKKIGQDYADWLIELDNFVYEETTAIEEKNAEEDAKRKEEEKEAAQKHADEIKAIWTNVSQTLQSTMEAPFEGLIRSMARGEANFKDFASSMVDAFGNMLVQMAARLAAYSAVFGLFNLFGGGAAFGGFNLLKGIGFAANGSDYLPAGWTMVGERGPEMIYNDKPGAKVVSNAELKQSGKQMTIVNNFNVREVKQKQIVDEIDTYNRRYERYGIATVGA